MTRFLKSFWARTKSVYASIKNFFVANAATIKASTASAMNSTKTFMAAKMVEIRTMVQTLRDKSAGSRMGAYVQEYPLVGFFLTAVTIFTGMALLMPKLSALAFSNPTISAVVAIGLFMFVAAALLSSDRQNDMRIQVPPAVS